MHDIAADCEIAEVEARYIQPCDEHYCQNQRWHVGLVFTVDGRTELPSCLNKDYDRWMRYTRKPGSSRMYMQGVTTSYTDLIPTSKNVPPPDASHVVSTFDLTSQTTRPRAKDKNELVCIHQRSSVHLRAHLCFIVHLELRT